MSADEIKEEERGPFYYEQHVFKDEHGRTVVARSPNRRKPGFAVFVGVAKVYSTDPRTRNRIPLPPIEFNIPAEDLDEAFRRFDKLAQEAADKRVNQMNEEQRKIQIAPRGQMPPNGGRRLPDIRMP